MNTGQLRQSKRIKGIEASPVSYVGSLSKKHILSSTEGRMRMLSTGWNATKASQCTIDGVLRKNERTSGCTKTGRRGSGSFAREPSTDWEDTPAVAPAAGVAAAPAVTGLKTKFLREFQPQHYSRFQEAKLRQRKQGINEYGIEYFYDVIDLCRRVDPGMSEEAKVDYLFRGLKPTLVEKIWVASPTTTAGFLTVLKLHTESSELANRPDWAVSILGPEKNKSPGKPEGKDHLRDLVLELKAEIADMKRTESEDQKAGATWKGPQKNNTGGSSREEKRNEGTEERDTRTTVGMVSADEDDAEESTVLLIDSWRLITEDLICQGIRVRVVIDTGAVVSVASPSLQEKLQVQRTRLDGPSVLMVNGQKAPPLGAFELDIEHRGMKARGKVILLEMKGIELLLGNDFLSQFKRLQINYVEKGAELLLGELPVNAITERGHTSTRKLVTRTGRTLPPRTIVPVEIEPANLEEDTWMIEPSEQLARARGVTTGKILVSTERPLGHILMVNLTNRRTYLREGTVLGRVEAVDSSVVEIEEAEPEGRREQAAGESLMAVMEDREKSVPDTPQEICAFRVKPSELKSPKICTLRTSKNCELGFCKVAEHRINTGSAPPVHQPPYKSAWKERAIIQRQVGEMLEKGVIEPSNSPWASPVVLVKKKDGSWRFCVDYPRLNAISVKDVYPLPGIEETLSRMGNACIFSTMYLESGYWQVPMHEEAKAKTAFVTPDGLYQFLVMPRVIPQLAQTAKPLTDLFKKGGRFVWEQPQEDSFEFLKQALCSKLLYHGEGMSRLGVGSEEIPKLYLRNGDTGSDGSPRSVLVADQKGPSRPFGSLDPTTTRVPAKNCSSQWDPAGAAKELDEDLHCMLAALSVDSDSKIEQQRTQQGQWGQYREKDGLLFHVKIVNDGYLLRLCVPNSFRNEIMRSCHHDITAGHLDVTRTLAKIRARYYWEKMSEDVRQFVRECRECQSRKPVYQRPPGYMEINRAKRPFERIGMDILGPFPLSKGGNRHIVVAVDYVTKWAETRALPTADAVEVANFLVKAVLLRHGAPRQLTTDRERCFIAEVTQNVLRALETNHRTTTAYRPQANGLVERLNHTLADMLSMYVSSDHRDWDESLPFVTFAYNTSRHESTGRTPFYLVYGKEAVLPIDSAVNADPNPIPPPNRDPSEWMLKRLQQARIEIQSRAAEVQRKRKELYDEGRREAPTYPPGAQVLVYKPIRKVGKSEKVLHRWFGPYTVVRQTTPSNYELRLGRSTRTEIVHVERVKSFYDLTDPKPQSYDPTGTSTDLEDQPPGQNQAEDESQAGLKPSAIQSASTRDVSETGARPRENKRSNAETPTAPSIDRPEPQQETQTRRESERGIRRSARIRAQRKTFLLTFPLLMLLAVMTGPTPTRSKEIIAYQGVIFKSEGEVTFSDTEGVVVTDFKFDPVDRMIKTLFDLLDGKVGAMTYQYDGFEDKFKKALQHQVELRARSVRKEREQKEPSSTVEEKS
ncbi:Uncharacterized protein APZ42_029823 [Daphnia magna]|uniref:RNA-directed DNA polymerase n=1 Tax=Daphnia magna TaxID=35525 RepID=A0A164PA79_9CRUS|nr:Uncharacterized protein APZ42_029823 [Daphnia magna]